MTVTVSVVVVILMVITLILGAIHLYFIGWQEGFSAHERICRKYHRPGLWGKR